MPQTVSVENMRRLEQVAVDGGLSYTYLMENAGAALAQEILSRYHPQGQSVVILCGSGNNGGDGYVAARLLAAQRVSVTLIVTAAPRTALAREMAQKLTDDSVQCLSLAAEPYLAAASVKDAAVIVDAVYGIGFHGELSEPLRALFRVANASPAPIVAADVPSGMDAQTGDCDPDAIFANLTVTFTAAKPALLLPTASRHVGLLCVAPVGIDQALVSLYGAGAAVLDRASVAACFAPRPADSNKGTFGRLLCVVGSYGMAGAAMLAGDAALRCGLGLLDMATPRSLYPLIASQIWEAIYTPLPETPDGKISVAALPRLRERLPLCKALLIGCGLAQHPQTAEVVETLLKETAVPTVLDADGLNFAATHTMILQTATAPLVLTPHPGEMARLCGLTIEQVQADRVGVARRFAAQYGVTVVLKGHRTVIATPEGAAYINPTGCNGMATGGSGDVLAGMIASFLAQGMTPLQAAICGVYLHGLAGQQAAQKRSQTGMLPRDLLEELPSLFLQFEKQE